MFVPTSDDGGVHHSSSYLPFNVSELGEHERPVESKFCHIVVVKTRRQDLRGEETQGLTDGFSLTTHRT